MPRYLAIADDLTGAAEIAGMGLRHGLATRIVRQPPTTLPDGLTVIDTDTRLLSPALAAEIHSQLAAFCPFSTLDFVYKKTDSALRGNILTEITSLMNGWNLRSALLIAQNPSRNRIIRRGKYFIDNTPLHETSFAHDPDHPAHTSDVLEILHRHASGQSRQAVKIVAAAEDFTGIGVGEAENPQDINSFSTGICLDCLAAGGVDFFGALLHARGHVERVRMMTESLRGRVLIVCGSTSAYSRELPQIAASHRAAVCAMPDGLFDRPTSTAVQEWSAQILEQFRRGDKVLLHVSHQVRAGASQQLLRTLAEVVTIVLGALPIDHLLAAGGATAAAIRKTIGWHVFDVEAELATGVVMLKIPGQNTRLTIKPGSYRWPERIWMEETTDGHR